MPEIAVGQRVTTRPCPHAMRHSKCGVGCTGDVEKIVADKVHPILVMFDTSVRCGALRPARMVGGCWRPVDMIQSEEGEHA